MGIRIDNLDPTAVPDRDAVVPAMQDGQTVKLSLAQILGLVSGSDLSAVNQAASGKTGPADADTLSLFDSAASWALKKLTWLSVRLGVFVQAAVAVASAATCDIGSASSFFVSITGATTITSLGNAVGIQVGTLRVVQFSGALTLTNNASIVLPTGANITTAANDFMLARYEGAGVWRVIWYRGALATSDWTAGTSTKPGMPTPAQVAASAAAVLAGATVLTKEFDSAQQTITSAGAITVAHGMAALPKIIQILLICTTADAGYSVGDVIPIAFNGPANNNSSVGATYDTANISLRYGSNASVFSYLHKSTGVSTTLVNGSWRMIVRAWA